MCGIAGVISPQPSDADRFRRAGDIMRHRGPDAEGLHLAGAASLVFRRLAIIDLSPSGNQPMSNEDGTVWTVFNGEIYNFRELRAELGGRHRFRSKTDTETIIHGYEEWGIEGLLSRIDGMFAFAIWDENRQLLALARDRIGKKPLYHTESGEGFAFASTINALLELLPEPPGLDPAALDDYLVYQSVPSPRTIYAGIDSLPPAHWAIWRPGSGLEIRRYWELSYASKKRRREPELLEELDALVRSAVERRLVSDVPLGAFLSGGVDSSLVVGVMSALGAGPVEAVNIGFEDPQYDESPYARIVAAHCKASLHQHVLPPDEVCRLPEIIWHFGQPHADVSIVPTYAVGRAAREHVTVVLNGDGGDEAFAGYARPIVARAAEAVRRLVPSVLQGRAAAAIGAGGRNGRILAAALQRSAKDAFIYDRGLRPYRGDLYTDAFMERLAGRDPDTHYAAAWDRADGPTDCDRALQGDLTTYLPDQLLTKMDVATMAHSVEARSPLLDTKLLEFAASIPASQLTRGFQTKYLLKRLAERYVPPEVLYRRKRGFVMPASRWLRHELAPQLKAILLSPEALNRGIFKPNVVRRMVEEHAANVRDWGPQLWTMLVLEIWTRLFIDGSLARTDRLDAKAPITPPRADARQAGPVVNATS